MPMLQKVLVATDLSEASRTPLGYAAALSRRLNASLTALYVSPRYASYEPFPAFPSQAALDPARRQGLEDEVRRFVESAAGPQPVEVVVRDGDPADEILAAAGESTFDLVVLGTHGRRGFERWSLGSVTDRVARRTRAAAAGGATARRHAGGRPDAVRARPLRRLRRGPGVRRRVRGAAGGATARAARRRGLALVRPVADLRSRPGRGTPGGRRGGGGDAWRSWWLATCRVRSRWRCESPSGGRNGRSSASRASRPTWSSSACLRRAASIACSSAPPPSTCCEPAPARCCSYDTRRQRRKACPAGVKHEDGEQAPMPAARRCARSSPGRRPCGDLGGFWAARRLKNHRLGNTRSHEKIAGRVSRCRNIE